MSTSTINTNFNVLADYRKQVAEYRSEITTEKTRIENYIEQLHRVGFEMDAKLGVVDNMLQRMDDMDDNEQERNKSMYSGLAWKVRAAEFMSRLDDIDSTNTVSTVAEPETISLSSTESDDLESLESQDEWTELVDACKRKQADLDLSDTDSGSEYENDSSDDENDSSDDEISGSDIAAAAARARLVLNPYPEDDHLFDSSDDESEDDEPTAPIISSHQLPDRLEYSSSDDSDQEDLTDFILEDSVKVEADALDTDTSPPPAKRIRRTRKFFHNEVFAKGSGWAIRGGHDGTCRDM